MKIEHLNATFQPAKIGHPHGLQVTYLKDNSTRNVFVYHEDGKVGARLGPVAEGTEEPRGEAGGSWRLRPHPARLGLRADPQAWPQRHSGVTSECSAVLWVVRSAQSSDALLLLLSRSAVPDSRRPHGLQPTRLLHPWDFPGESTGVGCRRLLHIEAQCV